MPLPDDLQELATEVRNWGRWGDDDQIGTINLITPEVRQRAAAAVRSGRAFSLALPLDEEQGIQLGFVPGRNNPVRRMTMLDDRIPGDEGIVRTNDDAVDLSLQAATHWDGLGHVTYDGTMWNGYPADSITDAGAARAGIHHISSLTTRGVLLDVARAKGVDVLEGGYAITGDDLDAAAELGEVEVQPGDAVLVRTGQMVHLPDDKVAYAIATGGPSSQSVRWFREHDVAAVATDNLSFEPYPYEREDAVLCVHMLHLVDMGLTQGQNWVLDELAADCADDGQYDFLLEASPQPFVNAVGSPVNPVAVK